MTNQIQTNTADHPKITSSTVILFFLSVAMDNYSNEGDDTWIPEGYVEIKGPNGKLYLVPEFYAPAINHTLDGGQEKERLETEMAAGTVSH
jgi:hypothetical protein